MRKTSTEAMGSRPPSHPGEELTARIETRAQNPDLCTIYPPDTEGLERMSTWITAKEGSFTSLEDAR